MDRRIRLLTEDWFKYLIDDFSLKLANNEMLYIHPLLCYMHHLLLDGSFCYKSIDHHLCHVKDSCIISTHDIKENRRIRGKQKVRNTKLQSIAVKLILPGWFGQDDVPGPLLEDQHEDSLTDQRITDENNGISLVYGFWSHLNGFI